MDQKYFKKITKKPAYLDDILWNLPDSPQEKISVFGGSASSFSNESRFASEFENFGYGENIRIALPDQLAKQLPLDSARFIFLPSTPTGSFADSPEFVAALNQSDYNIFFGDFTKNSITSKAVLSAVESCEKPLLITRDTLDLLTEQNPEKALNNKNLTLLISVPQLQKLFQAVFYPKVIMLSMSLLQFSEALHKFTLSYPISLVAFHGGQIILAKDGEVRALPLELTNYSPITLWSGDLAAKIAVFNLCNPGEFEKATITACLATF